MHFVNLVCELVEGKEQMQVTFIHVPNKFHDRLLLWGGMYLRKDVEQSPMGLHW